MRFLKQLIYGTFYLVIFGSVASGIYYVALRPDPSCFDDSQNGDETGIDCGGSCISCAEKNLKPLAESDALLYGVDRVYTASVSVRNSSPDFGVRNFSYVMNFYDAGGTLLRSVANKSFIYANESKNIVEAGVRITNGIPDKAEMIIDDTSVEWVSPVDFFEPKYEMKDVVAELDGDQVAVSGSVLNPNNFSFTKAVISVFLSDGIGLKSGASRTELNNVGQFRQEGFKIFIPVRKDMLNNLDLSATAKSVSVSVLK